jgi:hypothetical protein
MMLVDKLLLLLNALPIHLVEQILTKLDIGYEAIAAVAGEVLAHDDAEHLEIVGVGRHGVSRHDPAAHAELMGEGELVVVTFLSVLAFGQPKSDKWQTLAGLLGHDDKAERFERVREIVGCAGQVGHDGTVTVLSEPDELVVLPNDLTSAFAEVEGEGSLVGAEVVDVEDELLGEVLGATPDDPADTGVNEAVLSRH